MTTRPLRRRILQALVGSSVLVVLGVAVIGFAHTEAGRPLLRYIPGMGACPLGPPLTAEDQTRVRGEILAPYAGDHPAASRRVLSFELGRTTSAEVSAWATHHGLACAPGRRLALRCTGVPAQSLDQVAAFDAVSFDFDAEGRLVTLEGSASLTDPALAAGYVAARDRTLRDQLGAPVTTRGEAQAAVVAAGPLSQISREFRSSDIRTHVAATNDGHGRYNIREFHQLITG